MVVPAVGASVPVATISIAAHSTAMALSLVERPASSSAQSSVAPSAVGKEVSVSMLASFVALKEISVEDVSNVLSNLSFPALVVTFQSNGVSGKAIARISSYQDILDMSNNKISKCVAETFFEDFVLEWQKSGLVPKKLLQQPSSSASTRTTENPISQQGMVVEDPVSILNYRTEVSSSIDMSESEEFGKEDGQINTSSAQTNFATKFEASLNQLISSYCLNSNLPYLLFILTIHQGMEDVISAVGKSARELHNRIVTVIMNEAAIKKPDFSGRLQRELPFSQYINPLAVLSIEVYQLKIAQLNTPEVQQLIADGGEERDYKTAIFGNRTTSKGLSAFVSAFVDLFVLKYSC